MTKASKFTFLQKSLSCARRNKNYFKNFGENSLPFVKLVPVSESRDISSMTSSWTEHSLPLAILLADWTQKHWVNPTPRIVRCSVIFFTPSNTHHRLIRWPKSLMTWWPTWMADKVAAWSQARPLEANQGQWEPTNQGPGSQPICKSMHFMSKSVKILRFLPALGENFVYEPRAFF